MPAKKKRSIAKKKSIKTTPKVKDSVEKKGEVIETEEPQTTSDVVIPSPQTSIESQPDSLPHGEPAQTAASTEQPESIVQSQQSTPAQPAPVASSVTPQPQTPTPQIISTTGQVLPANGVTSSSENQPQIPTVTPSDPSVPSPSQPSSFQLDEPDTGNKKHIIFMILLILVIATLIGIGFAYRSSIMSIFSARTPTPTPLPISETAETKPTKAPETVKLDTYSITVLNGSGTAGEASKVKDILLEKGYKVDSVGNADTSDFEETVIQAKSAVGREFLDTLKKVLSETYELDPVDSLSETDDADVVITIGKNQKDQ